MNNTKSALASKSESKISRIYNNKQVEFITIANSIMIRSFIFWSNAITTDIISCGPHCGYPLSYIKLKQV